ncbi:MAG TPA: hypothetical protein VGI45_25105 [Terracidiphilus sp.]|jgi:hypothetical protein
MQVPQRKSSSSIETGDTGWISIHIESDRQIAGSESKEKADGIRPYSETETARSEGAPLFALAAQARTPLPERYPRLTFLMISLLLLISALTAEFEYLRGAGYSWP